MKPLKDSFRDTFHYGNYMYVLAGCVAEKLGGNQTYPTLLHRNIFAPLGMNSTTTIGALLRTPCEGEANEEEGDEWVGPSTTERRQCGNVSITEVAELAGLSRMYFLNDTSQELEELDLNMLRLVFML